MMRSSIIVLTIAGCVLGKCPDGWYHHGEFCYFYGTDELNWNSANEACSDKGGYLAEPKTKVEADYVEAFVRQHRIAFWGYWLGGTDKDVEGQWIWAHSSEPFSSTYTNWYPSEPNDNLGEDCMNIMGDNNQQWNDKNCETTMNYICEQKLSSISTGPEKPNFG